MEDTARIIESQHGIECEKLHASHVRELAWQQVSRSFSALEAAGEDVDEAACAFRSRRSSTNA